MKLTDNQEVFLALLRAGLWADAGFTESWSQGVTGVVDWEKVYQLAAEQSVQGLVLAGIERYKNLNFDLHLDQKQLLQWIGEVQMIEQQNLAMNKFVGQLIERLRKEDIYALLVKGQGIAQCYEKPMWRASGDVDLLLSEDNYQRAKALLLPKAVKVEQEYSTFKHLGMTMKGGFEVELHGALYTRLSKRIDKGIDALQNDVFCNGNVRIWQNGNTQVFLPGVDCDVLFVFTHILHHFYIEGIGLRQICDWCRLLWIYRDSLNHRLLESRIRRMGLMSEWQAFAAFAVDWLGMPVEAMPFYSADRKWSRKAERIIEFVLECGNFGNNRQKSLPKSFIDGKIVSVWRKVQDFGRHARVFPLDSLKFFFHFLGDGIQLASEQR